MPISAAGNNPPVRHLRTQRGVTLIELLVVLIIMALMTSFALLTVVDRPSRAAEIAFKVQAVVSRLGDLAVTDARPHGLRLEGNRLLALRYDGAAWAPIGAPFIMPENLTAALELEEGFALPLDEEDKIGSAFFEEAEDVAEERAARAPQVVIDATGEVTPFRLQINEDDQAAVLHVDELGRMDVTDAAN